MVVPNYIEGQPQRQFDLDSQRQPILEIGPSATRSIRGWKTGVQIALKFGNRYAVGVFGYYKLPDAQNSPDAFHGIYGLYLFNRYSRLQFGPSLRVGYFRKRFLTIIPTMEAVAHITRRISISGGMGYSDRFPYFDMKMSIGL